MKTHQANCLKSIVGAIEYTPHCAEARTFLRGALLQAVKFHLGPVMAHQFEENNAKPENWPELEKALIDAFDNVLHGLGYWDVMDRNAEWPYWCKDGVCIGFTHDDAYPDSDGANTFGVFVHEPEGEQPNYECATLDEALWRAAKLAKKINKPDAPANA